MHGPCLFRKPGHHHLLLKLRVGSPFTIHGWKSNFHSETRFFQGRSVSISRYEDRGRPVRTADSERLASECLADSIGWSRRGLCPAAEKPGL